MASAEIVAMQVDDLLKLGRSFVVDGWGRHLCHAHGCELLSVKVLTTAILGHAASWEAETLPSAVEGRGAAAERPRLLGRR